MKKRLQNNKIIYAILTLIIILGAIIAFTLGFNYELKYNENKAIQIQLGEQFKIKEINSIVEEIFKNKEVVVEYVEEFKDTVYITTNEITEEEKTSLIQKINEKFGKEYVADDFEIITNPKINLFDQLKQYILPIVWSSVIILLYFIFIYRKIGIITVTVTSVIRIILSQVVLFSLIAITRFPLGKLTLTLVIITYIITIACLINKFEKEKTNIKIQNKKA